MFEVLPALKLVVVPEIAFTVKVLAPTVSVPDVRTNEVFTVKLPERARPPLLFNVKVDTVNPLGKLTAELPFKVSVAVEEVVKLVFVNPTIALEKVSDLVFTDKIELELMVSVTETVVGLVSDLMPLPSVVKLEYVVATII